MNSPKRKIPKNCSIGSKSPLPEVSFVTVCFRTPDLIRNLLRSIAEADFDFSFEFFLVNNDPTDKTNDMVRELYPWVKIVNSPENIGFGPGNNLALKQMRGKYAMLTNPDLIIPPGEMEKLLDFAKQRPNIGLLGPLLLNPNKTRQDSIFRFPKITFPLYRRTFLGKTKWGKREENHYLLHDLYQENKTMEVDALMGSAILIRQEVFNDIGYFDENIFMYMEEFDLARRAWKNKWRVVYHPSSKMIHYLKRQSRIKWPWQIFTNKITRIHIKSMIYYFWKYRHEKNPHPIFREVQ